MKKNQSLLELPLFLSTIILSFFSITVDSGAQLKEKEQQIIENENFIIAKVNDYAITKYDITSRYLIAKYFAKLKIVSNYEKSIFVNQIIEKMIDEELIRQTAKDLKINISPQEIEETLELIALKEKKNPDQLKIIFRENNLSLSIYIKQIEAELLWNKIINQHIRNNIKINDAEIIEFLEQNKTSTRIEKFLIAQIAISQQKYNQNEVNESGEIANKLFNQLKMGVNFEELSKQFSQSIENEEIIGWVTIYDIDSKIYNIINKLQKNQYSEPIKLNDAYYIFKLKDKKIEVKIPEREENQAKLDIGNKKLKISAKTFLNELRKKSFIEIKQKKLLKKILI